MVNEVKLRGFPTNGKTKRLSNKSLNGPSIFKRLPSREHTVTHRFITLC
jgi:hypothetical protein